MPGSFSGFLNARHYLFLSFRAPRSSPPRRMSDLGAVRLGHLGNLAGAASSLELPHLSSDFKGTGAPILNVRKLLLAAGTESAEAAGAA